MFYSTIKALNTGFALNRSVLAGVGETARRKLPPRKVQNSISRTHSKMLCVRLIFPVGLKICANPGQASRKRRFFLSFGETVICPAAAAWR